MKFNKKMVLGVSAFVALYTAAAFTASCFGITVPPELTTGVFSLCGGEGVLLFLLHKFCG